MAAPGCFLAAPWLFPGCFWLLLAAPGCSLAAPWLLLGYFWLLFPPWLLPGCSNRVQLACWLLILQYFATPTGPVLPQIYSFGILYKHVCIILASFGQPLLFWLCARISIAADSPSLCSYVTEYCVRNGLFHMLWEGGWEWTELIDSFGLWT